MTYPLDKLIEELSNFKPLRIESLNEFEGDLFALVKLPAKDCQIFIHTFNEKTKED